MYYYEKNRRVTTGGGLLDSLIGAVTSQAAKEVASSAAKEVAKKTFTEVGNRGMMKIVDKIISPKRSRGLNEINKTKLSKYIVPIQDFVKQ